MTNERKVYKMTVPGFTAEVALSRAQITYQNSGETTARVPAVIPQFVGLQHCYWECIPGTGCGYFCEFHPF